MALENNSIYKFIERHKKIITIVEGLAIIILLASVNTLVIKFYLRQGEMRETCGYTEGPVRCICEKSFVDNWEKMQKGEEFNLNISGDKDVSLDG